MLVVDTSAVIAALGAAPPPEGLRERMGDDGDLHAPHLIDVEFLHALRRLVARGELAEDRALDVRVDFDALRVVRYPHQPLADRIWTLRDNLTAYDGAFVALAEALGTALITCDARLGRVAGLAATIEVFDSRPSPGG